MAGDTTRVVVQLSWLERSSTTRLVVVSILCGVLAWAVVAGSDLLSLRYGGVALVPMATADVIVGVVIGVLVLRLMMASRARRRRLAERLRTIAEMNHHIRNALEQIEMSAHITHNRQLIEPIHDAVKQIEWTLREVLPGHGKNEENETVL